jgi:hypothetical protein
VSKHAGLARRATADLLAECLYAVGKLARKGRRE